MVNFRKMLWMCFFGSLLATGAMAALVAYSFAGDAPVAKAADRGYLHERAPLPGRLNALLVSEGGAGVDVFVPPLAGLPGVDVTVDPGGVDVTVNPACPPGGCPDEPNSYTDPYAGRYDEDSAEYDAYADEGGGGKARGFLSKLRKRGGGGFLSKLREREGGPLGKLLGKLFRCGR